MIMKKQNGFTLIELMIVIAILFILIATFGRGITHDNQIKRENYVRECLMEAELPASDCEVNAARLYPDESKGATLK